MSFHSQVKVNDILPFSHLRSKSITPLHFLQKCRVSVQIKKEAEASGDIWPPQAGGRYRGRACGESESGPLNAVYLSLKWRWGRPVLLERRLSHPAMFRCKWPTRPPCLLPSLYRGTSRIRKCTPIGPYLRPLLGVPRGS
jgi:hypothetical protein